MFGDGLDSLKDWKKSFVVGDGNIGLFQNGLTHDFGR